MKSHIHQLIAASGLLLAVFAAQTRAQELVPFGPANYETDLQLFAPVELDLDAQPYKDDYGFFASWTKCYWSYSGERVIVGDPNVTVLAERVYIQNNSDLGQIPQPYTIVNGLQDVSPDAGFAFGDRYEIGYKDKGNGWQIGILDGPSLEQSQVHGLGSDPPISPFYTDNTGIPGNTAPQAGANIRAFGFGSVHVNFETPAGYLQGFRDYLNYLANATIGTQVGPTVYAGNYGASQEATAGNNQTTITVFRVADDINENGIPGSVIVIDPATGLLTTITDFGDLHEFNVAFQSLVVRNNTKTNGVEAMWTHELDNRHYMAKNQNNRLEVAAGARYLSVYDDFDVTGNGGILDASFWDTSIRNQIVGPQIGASWTNQRQRWTFNADTRFLFGYNVQDWHQTNGIGSGLIPGALNRPLYAQPTYSNRQLTLNEFSPVGELRVNTAYYLTQSIKFTVGYTGMYVGNIRRAATSVKYTLPDLGFRDSGTQNLIINGVNFGAEFCY